jgi:cellulose synthase/poly-beta-1,6-N-acetylglucosamine synthase-like glycosyltransferase
MLHDWRSADTEVREQPKVPRVGPISFSLIVPARHETAVLPATLSRLVALDHPSFEVVVVVGHDDIETRVVAELAADAYPGQVKVVVDDNWPKNKPKALNVGLAHCRGNYVGVFDAEDEVASLCVNLS